MNATRLNRLAVSGWICLLIVGCGDQRSDSADAVSNGMSRPGYGVSRPEANTPPRENQPPTISGTAPTEATVGSTWVFQPDLTDPDGDTLTVSASGLPGWMQLDPRSGRVSGNPAETDIQTWSGIRLRVSDGADSASLARFAVTVVPENAGTGSVTLSWLPPTESTDGLPIGELGGYRLLYGQTSRTYTETIEISNPGITRYMIEGLASGDWYFAIQTVAANGQLSEPSAEARTTI